MICIAVLQIGRKYSLLILYTVNAAFAISFYLSPLTARPYIFVVTTSLFLGNYFMLDTFILELLPTTTRNFGFNLLETFAKIGSASASFVVDLAGQQDPGFPPLIFGILMAVSSLVFIFLPETNGKPLPQTNEDVRQNFRKNHFCFRAWKSII